jgi:hypothetical protein
VISIEIELQHLTGLVLDKTYPLKKIIKADLKSIYFVSYQYLIILSHIQIPNERTTGNIKNLLKCKLWVWVGGV